MSWLQARGSLLADRYLLPTIERADTGVVGVGVVGVAGVVSLSMTDELFLMSWPRRRCRTNSLFLFLLCCPNQSNGGHCHALLIVTSLILIELAHSWLKIGFFKCDLLRNSWWNSQIWFFCRFYWIVDLSLMTLTLIELTVIELILIWW